MSKDIKTLLKEATKDLLTEDTLNGIEQAFDVAVKERSNIQVEKALLEQDNEYADKLEKLVNAIDKDHTLKLNRVMEAIDINHAKKLKHVIMSYEKQLTEEAGKFKGDMVNTLSKYLDMYLEEKIPTQSIQEATFNKRSTLVLQEIKKILAVDHAMAQESIREAVVDGKNTIDELQQTVDELSKKNKQLSEAYVVTKSQLLVEQKISDLDEERKAYMHKMLESKSPKYITENFEYILSLYDKNEEETLDILKEQATASTNVVDAEVPKIVEESAGESVIDPAFRNYLSELGKY